MSEYYVLLALLALLFVFERQKVAFLLFMIVSVLAFDVQGMVAGLVYWLLFMPVRYLFAFLLPSGEVVS